MEKRKQLLIIGALVVLVLIAGIFLIRDRMSDSRHQEVSMDEPINIVLDFYETWAAAARSTSTDPYQENLIEKPLLGKDLTKKLKDTQKQFEDGIDPVLCQTGVPEVISARTSYQLENEAQILVLSRDEGFDGQSVATLTKLNDGWYISDIACSLGEFGEEREFSFEKDGYLLKSPELGSGGADGLYFVYAENGVFGSAAPLVFTPESICRDLNGDESTCNTESFGEKTKALVRGEMSETGVSVKQLHFIEGSLSFE